MNFIIPLRLDTHSFCYAAHYSRILMGEIFIMFKRRHIRTCKCLKYSATSLGSRKQTQHPHLLALEVSDSKSQSVA